MQFMNQEIKEDKKVCHSIHEMVWKNDERIKRICVLRNLVGGRGVTGKKVAAAAFGAVAGHGVTVAAEGGSGGEGLGLVIEEGGLRVVGGEGARLGGRQWGAVAAVGSGGEGGREEEGRREKGRGWYGGGVWAAAAPGWWRGGWGKKKREGEEG
ncbi:uncharacterized protein LOC130934275 [Arachis stenosperma]|uniref:uncharacterized protein LOC130934275 n=1 Tax=Arachis stenosperma TaxID=217475 RepID=UPI0025AD0C7D|nr:uncharacterized protein LOC130934275 [Arachis stenosperma]